MRQTRCVPVTFTLLAQPRPGSRETRMREVLGGWLNRNQRGAQT